MLTLRLRLHTHTHTHTHKIRSSVEESEEPCVIFFVNFLVVSMDRYITRGGRGGRGGRGRGVYGRDREPIAYLVSYDMIL